MNVQESLVQIVVAVVANSVTAEGDIVLWGWRSLQNYHTAQDPE